MVKARNPVAGMLSSSVKGAWETPEGQRLAQELSDSANSSGYANCLRQAARQNISYAEASRRCAETTGLALDYDQDWGSPKASAPRVGVSRAMPMVQRL